MGLLSIFKRKKETYEVVKRDEIISYNNAEIQLIKNMYAKDATPEEFALLMYMSKKYGLDILTKEIWCVKYKDQPAQIYAGRDGFLKIGQRQKILDEKKNIINLFNGMETQVFRVEQPFEVSYYDKKLGSYVNFKKPFQYSATCTVFRKDFEHPITVTVWEEEYSTGQALWKTKRRTMIGKVAESQCLRKSFNISGLYSPEEMDLSILQNQGLIQLKETPENKIEAIEAEVVEEKEPPVLKEKPKEPKKDRVKEEKTEIPSIEDLKKRYMKKYPKSIILTKLKGDVIEQFLIGKFRKKEI